MRRTSLNLAHKVCLVTGGAQGIGWAITSALAAAGATVHACDISDEFLTAATIQCKSRADGHRISLTKCDVTNSTALDKWISDVFHDAGGIDVLVNNAAFVCWEDFEAMAAEDAEMSMRTNYAAMVHAVRLVLPMMQRSRSGHIVNIGSSAGRIITRNSSAAYAASKAAVEAFTETLRLELSQTPVHITLVRPGLVAGTQFFQRRVPSTRLPRLADFAPLVTPPQVATAILKEIHKPHGIIDIPTSLRALYFLYDLFPGLVRQSMNIGGSARRDFGSVPWKEGTGSER